VTPPALVRHAERLLTAHALAGTDPEALAGLLTRCAQRRLATGQPLFEEADPAGEIIFLLEGRVSVLKRDPAGGARQIGSWFAPALVGGSAAVEGARRSASCVAGAPSLIAVLPATEAGAVLGDPGPAGAQLRFILLAAFTEALANTTGHLRELLTQPPDAPVPDLDRVLALLHGAKR
jgi:CRP-like cAMP-binding protein